MEPEWNHNPSLDDTAMLGLRQLDIDDYINNLHKKIEGLESLINSLKSEIKIQRKEIAGLREERRMLINNDNPPGRCINWSPTN